MSDCIKTMCWWLAVQGRLAVTSFLSNFIFDGQSYKLSHLSESDFIYNIIPRYIQSNSIFSPKLEMKQISRAARSGVLGTLWLVLV